MKRNAPAFITRLVLCSLTLLFFGSNIHAQCTHSIDLTDTYGDGWNGGTVTVNVNGSPVLTNITLGSGSGPQTFTFSASSGDVITVIETAAGSWPSEMRVEVFDGGSTTIIGILDPTPSPGNSGNGFCPNPDIPCGGIGLVTCTSRLTQSNLGMTDSGIAAPSCGGYAGGDCWYTVTVPASGDIQAEAYSGTLTDMGMAIYTASGGCGGTLTEVACDDDSGEGNMPMVNAYGLTPASTAYMRIWDKNNDQTGSFTIEVRDFGSLFCFTGDAVDLGSGCGQLTAASNDQNGAIWDADDLLDFGGDFTYDFTVNLGSNNGGADGMAFVMHNDAAGLATTGTSGGSLGAGGISNSLIVEIDTYLNTEDRDDNLTGVICSGGPDPDHLDIWTGGTINPELGSNCVTDAGERVVASAVRLMNGGAIYDIENGADHTLRLSYVQTTQTFTAEVLNSAATISYGSISYSPADPMALFGTTTPYFGFTASTGGLNNQQSGCLATAFTSLPVQMLNFQIDCIDGQAGLSWVTASETNNDYFIIERSDDGINFKEIARMDGHGTTSSATYYNWTDHAPPNGQNYYRLKQVDFNGAYEYSVIRIAGCATFEMAVYPNPSDGDVFIDHDIVDLKIEVRNALGQLIQPQITNVQPGRTRININDQQPGMYFITAVYGNKNKTYKIVLR